jgi:hypothetical protein
MRNQVRAVTVSESEIRLTQGHWTLIDNEDLPKLVQYDWSIRRSRTKLYAKTTMSGRCVDMHRFLLNFPPGEVDHANRNGLDNRRNNLRTATRSQNQFNRSGVVGVYFHKNMWNAQIRHYYKLYSATFKTKEEAIEWRRQKARELYGEFAP